MKIGKLKLYLETTVFNYYFDEDRTGHEDVLKLFEAIEAGKFEVYTSRYVTDELIKAPEPKNNNMIALIDKYNIIHLELTDEVFDLAELYIATNIIPASYFYDSVHVAVASVYGLDGIISYNFEHINRDKTRLLTTSVNNEEGYGGIVICTAKEVLNYEQ